MTACFYADFQDFHGPYKAKGLQRNTVTLFFYGAVGRN